MREEIKIKPVGIIHTPYKEPKGIPIQGTFEGGIVGKVELFPEYAQGLKDPMRLIFKVWFTDKLFFF